MKKLGSKNKITTKKNKAVTLIIGILVIVAIVAGGWALNTWGNSIEQEMLNNSTAQSE